ncbi:hypothetical protein NVP1187O_064 [Vibrio phage 1.187.O._10N.286.49.F1]|nr:hypothetical protein NVP1187O_064 [Vibrio phage 1.187.O._10N.286.49.F1]
MISFSKRAGKGSENSYQAEDSGKIKKEFTRDLSDNKLFPQIQVDDISKITDKNTEWYLDGDGIVWKSCSSVESLYLEVKNLNNGNIFEVDNIIKFKGLGKKISENSWLGIENVKREAKGEEPYKVEDFEITQKSRLNYKTEEVAFEQVQIMIRTKLKNLREQFQIDNIRFCIGEGECFRNFEDTVEPYKGQRSELRPIMLKRARKWVLEDLEGLKAPEGFENDDFVEWHAAEGWKDYKRHGVFSKGVIGEDKDMFSNAKLLINFGTHTGEGNPQKGKFKYPKPWIIGDTSVSVGEIDLVVKGVKNPKKECKASGLKWLILQAFFLGDTADHYKPLQHLKDYVTKYGEVQAYKDFADLNTPQDVLQKAVDLYAEMFPYGIQYRSHKCEDLDVDTLTYMETYFKIAYMTRSVSDATTFSKLCAAFKVDTSAITGNNKLTPPIRTFTGDEQSILDIQSVIESIITEDMKGCKQLKSTEKNAVFDRIKEKLEGIDFESQYAMIQEEK